MYKSSDDHISHLFQISVTTSEHVSLFAFRTGRLGLCYVVVVRLHNMGNAEDYFASR